MNFVRSNICSMRGYVPGEQPQSGKYIKLNTNENPYPASTSVERAIQAALKQGLTRYPDAMATAFRTRAAEVLDVEPDWILCGNGSDDILTIVTRAMVGQRELLRLPYPSYVLYKTLAEIQGARSEEIRFRDNWELADEFFLASPDLRLVFLPNPNSPSGTVIPRDDVLKLAQALPCPLLVDEAYADFCSTNCIDLVKQNEKIVVSRTLSKGYGLAGLRFGFPRRATPHHRATRQGKRLLQLRHVVDRGCDGGDRRPAVACGESRQDHCDPDQTGRRHAEARIFRPTVAGQFRLVYVYRATPTTALRSIEK